jgi:hypothetical protein
MHHNSNLWVFVSLCWHCTIYHLLFMYNSGWCSVRSYLLPLCWFIPFLCLIGKLIYILISLLIIFRFLAGQQLRSGEASARFNVQTKHPKADPDLSNSVPRGYCYFCPNSHIKGSRDACPSHGMCFFYSLFEWSTKDMALFFKQRHGTYWPHLTSRSKTERFMQV